MEAFLNSQMRAAQDQHLKQLVDDQNQGRGFGMYTGANAQADMQYLFEEESDGGGGAEPAMEAEEDSRMNRQPSSPGAPMARAASLYDERDRLLPEKAPPSTDSWASGWMNKGKVHPENGEKPNEIKLTVKGELRAQASMQSQHSLKKSATSRLNSDRRLSRMSTREAFHMSPMAVFDRLLDGVLPVVAPTARRRKYWDLMILLFVVYNAIMVPYQAGLELRDTAEMKLVGHIIDALFVCDLFYNFRTAYVNEQGQLIRDPRKIAQHYLHTWFSLDLISSLPFDNIVSLFTRGQEQNGTQVKLLAFLKTPRLLRLVRLLRFFERMKSANIFRIVRLMLLMCLIAHWVSCGWHLLALFFPEQEFIFSMTHDRTTSYLITFYGAFQLIVGNGLEAFSNLERLYSCVVLVVGACFYATVVGNMAMLVQNLNANTLRHNTNQDIASSSARYLGLPPQLQERIQEYYDYMKTFSHPGPEGIAIFGTLPKSLAEDVSVVMYRDKIAKMSLFEGCEEAFIRQLAVTLRMGVYMAGETLFHAGDVGNEMFVILKGKVAVTNTNSEMVKLLGEGVSFGELALLATARRTANCICLAPCDLAVLTRGALLMTTKDFPASGKLLKQRAAERLAAMEKSGTVSRNLLVRQKDVPAVPGAGGFGAAAPAVPVRIPAPQLDPGTTLRRESSGNGGTRELHHNASMISIAASEGVPRIQLPRLSHGYGSYAAPSKRSSTGGYRSSVGTPGPFSNMPPSPRISPRAKRSTADLMTEGASAALASSQGFLQPQVLGVAPEAMMAYMQQMGKLIKDVGQQVAKQNGRLGAIDKRLEKLNQKGDDLLSIDQEEDDGDLLLGGSVEKDPKKQRGASRSQGFLMRKPSGVPKRRSSGTNAGKVVAAWKSRTGGFKSGPGSEAGGGTDKGDGA